MSFHFVENSTNILMKKAFDPITKIQEYKAFIVNIEKAVQLMVEDMLLI